MRKIKITVKRMACYADLMAEYENPIEHACDMTLGASVLCGGWKRPGGFCESAWESLSPFVMTLAHGGENFYDGWMKNPKSAMLSCNDGFRPVSFFGRSGGRDGAWNGVVEEHGEDYEKVLTLQQSNIK